MLDTIWKKVVYASLMSVFKKDAVFNIEQKLFMSVTTVSDGFLQ